MLSSEEIRNIKFSKSVGGYKQDEVDIFLDKVEVDYDRYEKLLKEKDEEIAKLHEEIDSAENSKDSIQAVLLSAQKLAEQIIADAKTKSEEIVDSAKSNLELITVKEKELSGEFDRKANERKARFDEEMTVAVKNAENKLQSIQNASEDSVEKQQALFDKIKMDVKNFKLEIMRQYKEHLDLLQNIPDSVTDDPKRIAAAVEEYYNKKPDISEYVEETKEEPIKAEEPEIIEEIATEISEQPVEVPEEEHFEIKDFDD